MHNKMTTTEFINDRVYLFFHPIENLKMAFAKKETVANRLEIIDNTLIKKFPLDRSKKVYNNLASVNKYPPTFSIDLFDETMIKMFLLRKTA